MKYHVLFAIICAAVAMGVDYERQGHYRGMAFGELEVSSYVEVYAPGISGLGTEVAQGDLQLTDVVPLRGPLMDLELVDADITYDATALTPVEALNHDAFSDSQ